MIAASRAGGVKNRELAGNLEKLPLAGLDHGAGESLGRQLELRDRVTVDSDPALLDHAAPVAVRLAELVAHKLREINRAAVDARDRDLGLVRSPPLAHDAREVLLPAPNALVAV